MVTECAAILAVTLCIMVVLVRSGNGDYAASALPVLIVPAVHLVAVSYTHLTLPTNSLV